MDTEKQKKLQRSKKGLLGLILVLCSMLFFTLALFGIIIQEWSETTRLIVTILFFAIGAVGFVLGIKGRKQ